MEDSFLIQQIAAGGQPAFKELFLRYKDQVFHIALTHLQNAAEAEEITQDVFVEIFQSAARFKGESAVRTWIYRIAVNKSLDRLRFFSRKKRFGFIYALFTDKGEVRQDKAHFEHPGVLIEQREYSEALFRALENLPPKQKTAFVLAFLEDLPRQEVAAVMGLTLKAVESLLQRAKANLRSDLEEFYDNAKD